LLATRRIWRDRLPGHKNIDLVELEKRITQFEHVVRAFDAYIVSMEASYSALKSLLQISNDATDLEIIILLRAIVRLRGLTPKDRTKKHLIKAILEDEYATKLDSPTKSVGGPVQPQ
jgi:hypothetical protein